MTLDRKKYVAIYTSYNGKRRAFRIEGWKWKDAIEIAYQNCALYESLDEIMTEKEFQRKKPCDSSRTVYNCSHMKI